MLRCLPLIGPQRTLANLWHNNTRTQESIRFGDRSRAFRAAQGRLWREQREDLRQSAYVHHCTRGIDRNPVWLQMHGGEDTRYGHGAEILKP